MLGREGEGLTIDRGRSSDLLGLWLGLCPRIGFVEGYRRDS